MSQTPYYPPVDAATLRMLPVLMTQMANHGADAYLQSAPWPAESLGVLKEIARWKDIADNVKAGKPVGVEAGDEDLEEMENAIGNIDVERELATVYGKLKRFGQTLSSDQVSEKVSFFRITTALLTKLVDQMEKASNINQYAAFRQSVMKILGDVMTPDQRNEFLKRLAEQFGMPDPEAEIAGKASENLDF